MSCTVILRRVALIACFVGSGAWHPLPGQVLMATDSAARDALASARALRCVFDSGVGFEYGEATRPNTVPLMRPMPLVPGGYQNPDIIDQIDRARGTARLIIGQMTTSVEVLSGPAPPAATRHSPATFGNSLNILWQAGTNPALISVFPNLLPGSYSKLAAIITRHLEWFGGMSVSQHYGSCVILVER